MIRFLTTYTFILSAFLAFSQQRSNEEAAMLADFTYAMQIPGGDLADRFGININVGGGIDYLTEKNNLIFGIQGNVLFGNEVKQNVLGLIEGEEGVIYSDGGFPAEIATRERGIYLGGHFGKLFSISQINKRAGIRATLGIGLLQHKIRIQDDPQGPVSHLADEYKKGYDRLSNGLAFTQFIGYQYLARDRRINFFAGLEFTEAFTKNRRDFNFDTFEKEEENRFDLLMGFKVGWILPFYIGENPDEIFY